MPFILISTHRVLGLQPRPKLESPWTRFPRLKRVGSPTPFPTVEKGEEWEEELGDELVPQLPYQ